MVCDKDVCERWCVTKIVCERWCVKAEEGAEEAGYRIKNNNPTQRCGEKQGKNFIEKISDGKRRREKGTPGFVQVNTSLWVEHVSRPEGCEMNAEGI